MFWSDPEPVFETSEQIEPCERKISKKKCLCSHHNNTALIKQIFLFDTALGRAK